jgi:ubiquinol-cytochrome c reductase cytochrome b subunit
VFIQGGVEPGATTLTRIFAVHVVFVPLLLMIATAWHLYLVLLHGVTCKTERKQPIHTAEEQKRIYKEDAHSEERGECFYPETAAKSGAMAMAIFIFTLILVLTVGPQLLGPEANLTERSFPAEEWWFWWYSALIALLPPSIAPWFVVVFPIALFVLMVLLPFVDRGKYRGIRNRPLAAAFVIITVGGLLYLSDLRRRSPWTGWPDPELPRIPPGIELTAEALEGRVLYSQYGCNTCHAVAGDGRRVGPDLGWIQDRLSRAEYREYILQPPEGVAMPAYQGRISDEHLERIIDFVHAAQTFTQ